MTQKLQSPLGRYSLTKVNVVVNQLMPWTDDTDLFPSTYVVSSLICGNRWWCFWNLDKFESLQGVVGLTEDLYGTFLSEDLPKSISPSAQKRVEISRSAGVGALEIAHVDSKLVGHVKGQQFLEPHIFKECRCSKTSRVYRYCIVDVVITLRGLIDCKPQPKNMTPTLCIYWVDVVLESNKSSSRLSDLQIFTNLEANNAASQDGTTCKIN